MELPLEPELANKKMGELFDVYTLRDDWYVEKMLEEERVCAGDPPFEIVPYIMTRITHVERMLSLLRSRTPMKVVLDVSDGIIPENNGRFLWEVSETEGKCFKLSDNSNTEDAVLRISATIAQLTEFVFGKSNIDGLEDVKVLSGICINEAV